MSKKEYKILNEINNPSDLENIENLDELCYEIREKIISIVSKNGGHLASNLGVVELTVAIYKAFSKESDRIIWDVGHQCYAHKMLTGRFKDIDKIRLKDGISGFPSKLESKYDLFTSGHASTAISSALGFAYANSVKKGKSHTVVVIGDGALTGGLAYEGLNNAGKFKKNFIVVLNDNKMSISHNVGAIPKYLTSIRVRPSYTKMKGKVEYFLNKIPFLGINIVCLLRKMKSAFKGFLYSTTIFEDIGFLYYGPVDGHDLNELIKVFGQIKEFQRPVLLHVVTKKGKGYPFAEKDPKQFHGISKFDTETGTAGPSKESFSSIFGDEICSLASENNKICVITAAMKSGTGLSKFSEKYKNRFFDVGIAEGHAVTFAGGLATGGMIPVVAIYSTFMQRAYDQIIHDVAIQNIKVIFAVDRAGFVGEDGETHQGLFDVSFFNSIPKIKIFVPSFFDELRVMLREAVYDNVGSSVIRYPRGEELYKPSYFKLSKEDFSLIGEKESDILIITYGRIFSNACLAKEKILLENNLRIDILKLNVIKPIDENIVKLAFDYKYIFFFEESSKLGGVGEVVGSMLAENGFKNKYKHFGVREEFVKYSDTNSQMKEYFLDADSMTEKILSETGNKL